MIPLAILFKLSMFTTLEKREALGTAVARVIPYSK